MRTKYKTGAGRYRDKLKKHKDLNKSIIMSPYKLSTDEIEQLKLQFPDVTKFPLENIVDPSLMAGIVVNVGTRRIDLSLSRGLYSLKQYLYEQS